MNACGWCCCDTDGYGLCPCCGRKPLFAWEVHASNPLERLSSSSPEWRSPNDSHRAHAAELESSHPIGVSLEPPHRPSRRF